jgi:hypothetical protein
MFVVETVLLGAIVLGAVWALWNERRRAALLGAGVSLIVLTSYAAVYIRRGYSYEQWKWIAFFQPAFVVAVFSLVVAAGSSLLRRWVSEPRRMSWAIGAVLGVVLVATSARTLVNGTRYTRAVWAAGAPALRWSLVEPSLSKLAQRPGLVDSKSVNVNLPQWDEMWAAYFLQPAKRVYLQGPSYFPVTKPRAPVSVTSRPDPAAVIGYRYVIVRTPRPDAG